MAERVNRVLGVVPRWEPIRLPRPDGDVRGPADERIGSPARRELESRAAAYGLLPLRWPEPFPADTAWAMLAATYARHIGRAVAFSLAAFRQAFAAGRDLGRRDNVLIAAAACELHPAAVIKGAGLASTSHRLEEATRAAAVAGVRAVPAVRVADRVFHGDAELEAAAAALRLEPSR